MAINAERGIRAGGRGRARAQGGGFWGWLLLAVVASAIVAAGAAYAAWRLQVLRLDLSASHWPRWAGEGAGAFVLAFLVLMALRVPMTLRVLLCAGACAGTLIFEAQRLLEDPRILADSTRKAATLLRAAADGQGYSATRIKEARIGLLEPFVLDVIAAADEMDRLWLRHEGQWEQFPVKSLLAPERLATTQQRAQVRQQMAAFRADVDHHQQQSMALIDRHMEKARTSVKLLPAQYRTLGFVSDEKIYERTRYEFNVLSDAERDLAVQSTALLDFLDGQTGRYALSSVPSPRLQFNDDALLIEYRKVSSRVLRALDKIRDLRQRNAGEVALSKKRLASVDAETR